MKWELKEPTFGDIVKVKAESIYHYGIYMSDDEIIQFGLSPIQRKEMPDSEIEVCVSNIDEFMVSDFLEVGVPEKKDGKRFSPKKTIDIARSKIGEKGYNILYNNCEHFAYACYFGKSVSSQVDEVRAFFKKLVFADVYIAAMPSCVKMKKVYPCSRWREIQSITNVRVQKEKYFVWKLLEYGIKQSIGKKITDLQLFKSDTGKWMCDACEFSLSHSGNLVCVAISKNPIGIDIEKIQSSAVDVSKAILSDKELLEYNVLSQEEKIIFIIEAWSKKESLFKRKNIKAITKDEFRELNGAVFKKKIFANSENYVLSVATDFVNNIRVYDNIDLLKV